jgi:ABC-type nitrate/sulfonate/bicarbonate transport system substrate-binding protein
MVKALAVTAVGAGVTATAATPVIAQPKRYTARINQAFQALLYLPLYVANDVGFFDEEGVAVEITTAGGGPQSWSAVLGGSADYSIHDPIFPSISTERGEKDGIVVGTICNALAIMAAAKDPSIKRVSDAKEFMTKSVAGKKISMEPEPDSDWVLMKYLDTQTGAQLGKDYTQFPTPLGTQMAPVLAGRADIGLAAPPAADIALSQGLHEVFDFTKYLAPYAFSGLCTTKTFITKNPDTHQAVMNALEKACQYAYAFPQETVKIAQREFPDQNSEVIASAARRTLGRFFTPQHIYVDGEAWAANQRLNKFAGNIKQIHPIDEAVDNNSALTAYRQFGFLSLSDFASGPRPITKTVVR